MNHKYFNTSIIQNKYQVKTEASREQDKWREENEIKGA
jgi:hypothetical protein